MIDRELYEPIIACPLCASRHRRTIHTDQNRFQGLKAEDFAVYKAAPVNILLCLECDFAYADRLPKDSAFFSKLYNQVEYDYGCEFQYHGKKRIFQEIKAQLKSRFPSGRLLDIGAWCGAFLAYMSDTYTVVGCELSEEAGRYGRSRGLDIRIGAFDEVGFSPQSFDVITLIDVLEHLPQPKQVIEKAALLLKPKGALYIKVPNGRGQIKKQRLLNACRLSQAGVAENFVHINHFSHLSLKTLLDGTGFTVLEKGYTQPEIWDLSSPQPTGRIIKRWLDNQGRIWITRVSNQLSRACPDLGFNIYTLAQKL